MHQTPLHGVRRVLCVLGARFERVIHVSWPTTVADLAGKYVSGAHLNSGRWLHREVCFSDYAPLQHERGQSRCEEGEVIIQPLWFSVSPRLLALTIYQTANSAGVAGRLCLNPLRWLRVDTICCSGDAGVVRPNPRVDRCYYCYNPRDASFGRLSRTTCCTHTPAV